jgi:protein phosphatase
LVSFTGPDDRMLLSLGDLVDRGPRPDLVLALFMQLVEQGFAAGVRGNHDDKYMRYLLRSGGVVLPPELQHKANLKGEKVRVGPELARTIELVDQHGPEFRQKVFDFLRSLPFKFETDDVIAVHAAHEEGVKASRAKALALYGETSGQKDEHGRPIRLDLWETRYKGRKVIVHGHIPVREVTVRNLDTGGKVFNLDTGCCFGGKLTALRLPQMEFVSVPALARYAESPDIGDDE